MQVVVQFSLPLPLGEGRGEGLVWQARNNSPGFSPRAASRFFNAVHVCEEFLNGLRAEARSKIVVVICAQALTLTLSQRERESNCTTTLAVARCRSLDSAKALLLHYAVFYIAVLAPAGGTNEAP